MLPNELRNVAPYKVHREMEGSRTRARNKCSRISMRMQCRMITGLNEDVGCKIRLKNEVLQPPIQDKCAMKIHEREAKLVLT